MSKSTGVVMAAGTLSNTLRMYCITLTPWLDVEEVDLHFL